MNKAAFYQAMDSFAEKDRKDTYILISQQLTTDALIEKWYDKATGKDITVTHKTNGTYVIDIPNELFG